MKNINEKTFEISPQKAVQKIAINSTMIGALFFTLTFILTYGYGKFHQMVVIQLVCAIPLLFVSTLAYSKIGYWKDINTWDIFGWVIGNTGNTLLLNAIGLMILNVSRELSAAYFGLLFLLMTIYSVINIVHVPKREIRQKIFKWLFFISIMILGGVLPIMF